jgi:polysaccharide deacetylase family protein (PEP-CTERM system associated)
MSQHLNAMTVDVEDYFQVAALAERIRPADWEGIERRVVDNTTRLLDLFDERGIKGTFFILGWVAEREGALIKDIDRRGHEIASHGYSHQLVYNQTPEVFREETRRSKAIIEDLIGRPIQGYRAASYSITAKSFWALDILAEAGFTWDSSIFPIRHDRYGVPDAPTEPFRLTTPNGAELTEIPLTTASLFGQRLPAAGGGYFRLYPYWLSSWLFGRATKEKPGIFYLHPWEVDPGQPRVEGLSRLSRFRHYNKLDECLPRLERLIGEYRFGTVSEAILAQPPRQRADVNQWTEEAAACASP